MSALVIKSWRADTKPIDENNNYVSIVGREGGLIAWILSKVAVDPTTTITIGSERLEFSSASLSGTESRIIPLESISSSYYGYYKPWKQSVGLFFIFLFMAMSFSRGSGAMGGLMIFLITAGIGAVIAALIYYLNRTLTLGFVEQSGVVSGIRFKRSVIENIDINQEQSKMVCLLVQRLIESKQRRT